ncbi:MAG: hypothetical protein ABI723_19530 [Bacteroidia bacterium]
MIEVIRRDTIFKGFVIGLLAPFVGLFLLNISFWNDMDMGKLILRLYETKLLSPVISLCIIVSAALFYYFIQKDNYYTSRGIILATFIYGGIIIYLKFF